MELILLFEMVNITEKIKEYAPPSPHLSIYIDAVYNIKSNRVCHKADLMTRIEEEMRRTQSTSWPLAPLCSGY